MKKYMFAFVAFLSTFAAYAATPIDGAYWVTIPSTATNCVTPDFSVNYQPWDPTLNCYYVVGGDFTDTLNFTIADPGVDASGNALPVPTNGYEVVGNSYHFVGLSGRAHPSYTWDTTITNVVIVDAAGNIVAQAVNAPFWSRPQCSPTYRNFCSPHQTDDWFVGVQLAPGAYRLVIMATSSGNRPGNYTYTLTTDAVAPAVAPVASVDE